MNIKFIAILIIILSVVTAGYLIFTQKNGNIAQNSNVAPLVDGKQVVNMTVKAVAYSPNSFTVKAGVPVRWEITSSGESGCANGEIIANGLIDPIYLNPNAGQVTVKEFTPQTPGTYRFTCPMGMARGTITVIN